MENPKKHFDFGLEFLDQEQRTGSDSSKKSVAANISSSPNSESGEQALGSTLDKLGVAVVVGFIALVLWLLMASSQTTPATVNAPVLEPQPAEVKTAACDSGYFNSEIDNRCISGNDYCIEKFGKNQVYNSNNNTCECRSGYIVGEISRLCVSRNEGCAEKWPGTEWTGSINENGGSTCDCEEGYNWNIEKTECFDINALCRDNYGSESSYSGKVEGGKYICD